MVLNEALSMEQKLGILADAAKYDVACTSSGMQRDGKSGAIGNSIAAGICHSFSADGRCISLLKVLFTNECIYDCKYCMNRSSNDVPRASFTPRELCELTIGFYKRNYIEGLFLSSGILHTPDYTMELICKTLRMLREEYRFRGYIHCKAIPGANPLLVEYAGWYADRMSVNLELPTNEGLRSLAPNKTRKNILRPMRQIQSGIAESRKELGFMGGNHSAYWYTNRAAEQAGLEERFRAGQIGQAVTPSERGRIPEEKTGETGRSLETALGAEVPLAADAALADEGSRTGRPAPAPAGLSLLKEVGVPSGRGFAAAGQSTQMIIGATPETDYQLVSVAEALYQKFDLKRVFYSAFVKVNDDTSLPDLPGGPPLLREHRLYQADWLLRFYGFEASELLDQQHQSFNPLVDPKCNWAINHMEQFPVEVNSAPYEMLLRVPGIGVKSAQRILAARRTTLLDFDGLKRIGVVLKRAQYFLLCKGRMIDGLRVTPDGVLRALISERDYELARLPEEAPEQLSLFDRQPTGRDVVQSLTGQL